MSPEALRAELVARLEATQQELAQATRRGRMAALVSRIETLDEVLGLLAGEDQ